MLEQRLRALEVTDVDTHIHFATVDVTTNGGHRASLRYAVDVDGGHGDEVLGLVGLDLELAVDHLGDVAVRNERRDVVDTTASQHETESNVDTLVDECEELLHARLHGVVGEVLVADEVQLAIRENRVLLVERLLHRNTTDAKTVEGLAVLRRHLAVEVEEAPVLVELISDSVGAELTDQLAVAVGHDSIEHRRDLAEGLAAKRLAVQLDLDVDLHRIDVAVLVDATNRLDHFDETLGQVGLAVDNHELVGVRVEADAARGDRIELVGRAIGFELELLTIRSLVGDDERGQEGNGSERDERENTHGVCELRILFVGWWAVKLKIASVILHCADVAVLRSRNYRLCVS